MRTKSIRQTYPNIPLDFDVVCSGVIERVKEGVIILSQRLKPVHLNQKAIEICQQLWDGDHFPEALPPVISELLHWVSRNSNFEGEVFVMDYQLSEAQTIRVRVYQLGFNNQPDVVSRDRPWSLILLEDRRAILQDELQIEQKKYNLSDREAEVLNYLLQSYSYQGIAEELQVSLNTVKFHVKNINSKKDGYSEQKSIFRFQ